MTAESLCVLSLAATFYFGRRSLGAGVVALLAVGYSYGIVRANIPTSASHFIFDGAVVGLYAGVFTRRSSAAARYRSLSVQSWVAVLAAWPLLMFFVPMQDWAIQLVGLRGAIFFLPFLLIGARLEEEDLVTLVTGIAVLNIVELGFALAEFIYGIQHFYPRNSVTEIIYRSDDVTAGRAYRIPATFVVSAAYGMVMAFSIPFLAGAWAQLSTGLWRRRLLEAALLASGLGVFLSASRTAVILLLCSVIAILTSAQLKATHRTGLIVFLLAIAWFVTRDERLQRFTSLADMSAVRERVGWSVNSSFTDALLKYPMGNGLGGGGTSVPYFLQERLRNRVLIENEYGRILLEQGVFGLILWIAFVIWLLFTTWPGRGKQWYLGRLLVWGAVGFLFLGAPLGTGLLTAIPQTAMMLLACGWLVARSREARMVAHPALRRAEFEALMGARPVRQR